MKKDLTHYITLLLYEYDNVIIPNLGCIISTKETSYIYKDNIIPPYKELLLDDTKKEDKENILINFIQKKEKVSQKIIKEKIDDFVNNIINTLKVKKEIFIDKIGKIYTHRNKTYFFSQIGINYLKESFGLPLLTYKQLDRGTFLKRSHIFILIIFIVILSTSIYSYYTLNYYKEFKAQQYENSYKHPLKTIAVNDKIETHPPPIQKTKSSTIEKDNYFIIISSFKDIANANLEINRVRKESSVVYAIESNRGMKIGIAKFSTKEQAYSQIKQIKKSYPNAWIYKNSENNFKEIK